MLDELRHNLAVIFAFRAFQYEVFAADQAPVADEEDLHAGFAVTARQGDHVRIQLGIGDDLLAFHHVFEALNLVAQHGGFLVIYCPDSSAICFFRRSRMGSFRPSRNLHRSVDHLAVILLVDPADTGRGAQLDVVIQAGARVLAGDDAVAGAVLENLAQLNPGFGAPPTRWCRAEVTRAVLHVLARDGHLGKGSLQWTLMNGSVCHPSSVRCSAAGAS